MFATFHHQTRKEKVITFMILKKASHISRINVTGNTAQKLRIFITVELPSHFPEEVRHMSTFVVACVPTFSLPCFHVRGKLIRQTNLAHQIQTYILP